VADDRAPDASGHHDEEDAMVFDPTFHEIDAEAAELPDLDEDTESSLEEGDVDAAHLPPYGKE
jgi:hypothetical protein